MIENADDAAWPKPPVNVKLHLHTGEVITVDCGFSGWNNGIAIWEVLWDGPLFDMSKGDFMSLGELPTKSSVILTQVREK